MHDPDYWKFSNEDGKLERCDMRQFEADLDAAIKYQKEREEMKQQQRLDYHIADNAETPHVSITDAESGKALFQSVFSVAHCELAEEISKRFNSHEKLIEALQQARALIVNQTDDSFTRTTVVGNCDAALAEAGAVATGDCTFVDGDGAVFTGEHQYTNGVCATCGVNQTA